MVSSKLLYKPPLAHMLSNKHPVRFEVSIRHLVTAMTIPSYSTSLLDRSTEIRANAVCPIELLLGVKLVNRRAFGFLHNLVGPWHWSFSPCRKVLSRCSKFCGVSILSSGPDILSGLLPHQVSLLSLPTPSSVRLLLVLYTWLCRVSRVLKLANSIESLISA
jgi:hypothetical protein